MDGIDGISGIEAGSIGLGVFILALLVPVTEFVGAGYIGLGITAIMIGFLIWNWHPAKLFLGDVGSIPLGFILGWVLLDIASNGAWAIALILPSYYLFDATYTLSVFAALFVVLGLIGMMVRMPVKSVPDA